MIDATHSHAVPTFADLPMGPGVPLGRVHYVTSEERNYQKVTESISRTASWEEYGQAGSDPDDNISDTKAVTLVDRETGSPAAYMSGGSLVDEDGNPINAAESALLHFEDFGAAGDGSSNDVAALNAGLIASASQGKIVMGRPGANYRVAVAGTKTFTNGSGSPVNSKSYCVQIPDGAEVDWLGATLTVATGIDAVVLCNESTTVAGDEIVCRNLIVDGGGSADAVRSVPMVWLWGLRNSTLESIKVQNCSYVAGHFAASEDCLIDRLDANNVRGQAWMLGGNTFDKIKRCKIGTISASNINTYGTFNQPGNSFLIGADQTSIQRIIGRNCAGGHKFAPNCTDVHTDYAEFDGAILAGETSYGTANSGTKIQGDDALTQPNNISFGSIVSRNCQGAGIYIRFTNTLLIDKYSGYGNGLAGADNDMDIASVDHLSINAINSTNAGFGGVIVTTGTVRYSFGSVVVRDFAQVNTSNANAFAPLAGQGRVRDLVCTHSTNANAGKGISATSANVMCVIDNYRCNLNNRMDVRATQIFVGNAVFSTGNSPLCSIITLSAGTTTDLSNNNIASQTVTGGFVEPIIQLTPMNAAAQALGAIRYTITSTFNARFHHATAAGTEVFTFRVVGYTFRATQMS